MGVGCAVYRMTGNFAMDDLWEFLRTRWWGLLICALLFWAIAAFGYSHISRHEYVPVSWVGLIIYGTLGKVGLGLRLGFPRSVVRIRSHLEPCSQDSLRQERR